MIHVAKKLNFSQSSLRIDSIIERIADLLDRNFFTRFRVHSRTTPDKTSSI